MLNFKSANSVNNHQVRNDLYVNDIEIINDEHLQCNTGKLRKVLKTFLGRDGLIHSWEFKIEKGIIKRPLQLLVKLEY